MWLHEFGYIHKKKFTTLGPFVLSNTSTVGYFEKRSIHASKSWSFSLVFGPPKSIWMFSLVLNSFHLDNGFIGLKFWSIYVLGLYFRAFFKISRCMYGPKAYWLNVIIHQLPGCVRWSDSKIASCIELVIATLSSTHTHTHPDGPDVKVAPVRIPLGVDVLTSLLIVLEDTVSYLFEHGIPTGQHRKRTLC